MDINEMTPEQLREMAESKERMRAHLEERYLGFTPAPVVEFDPSAKRQALQPWEKAVEVEGVEYTLDMRRFRSRKVLKQIARAQRESQARNSVYEKAIRSGMTEDEATAAANEGVSIDEQLGYMTAMLGEEVEDRVAEAVTAKMGYDDIEEIVRIEGLLIESASLKN
ncbi:hypothetical protein [Collinsella sp. AM28-11LB]|uniref:hypothetical protein n=1 Tax=Collinsella sp. AM28-11LB TaxID=2292312 RepID=UPI000E52CDFA|nr:hypothetical protein [Collinsella sp. AM28-11LB]RHE50082.1 hypothetical protein DW732_09075 [Collinsella sp. AM28-11LB]